MDEAQSRATLTFWRNAAIISAPTTEPAKAIKTRDMEEVEDLADDAPPTHSDDTTHLGQTEKFQQIGPDASRCVLSAFVSKNPFAARKACIFLDAHVNVADFAKAVLALDGPYYYIGFCENAQHLEWVQHRFTAYATQKVSSGNLHIPDFTVPPEKLPDDLLQPEPPKPDLNALVWSDYKVDALGTECLKLPDMYLTRYHDHPLFGEQFRTWYNDAVRDHSLDAKADSGSSADNASPTKRARVEVKKETTNAKEELVQFVPNADLPTTLIHNVDLAKKGTSVKLRIAAGPIIHISNEGPEKADFQPGQLIAGFFKGKWSTVGKKKSGTGEPKGEEAIPDASVQFRLVDGSDVVLYNGKLSTVAALISERLKTSPEEAAVRYHTMLDAPCPENPNFFSLRTDHTVVYALQELPAKLSDEKKSIPQAHVASTLPTKCWESSPYTGIIWTAKFMAKGLSPCRPSVLVTRAFSLEPGQALCVYDERACPAP